MNKVQIFWIRPLKSGPQQLYMSHSGMCWRRVCFVFEAAVLASWVLAGGLQAAQTGVINLSLSCHCRCLHSDIQSAYVWWSAPPYVLSLVTTHTHTHTHAQTQPTSPEPSGGWKGGGGVRHTHICPCTSAHAYRMSPPASSHVCNLSSAFLPLSSSNPPSELSHLGLVEGKNHDATLMQLALKWKPNLPCNATFLSNAIPSLCAWLWPYMPSALQSLNLSSRWLTGQWSMAPFEDSQRIRALSLPEILKKCMLHTGWAQCAASLLQACTLHPNHWLKHEGSLRREPGVIQNYTIAGAPKHSKGIAV